MRRKYIKCVRNSLASRVYYGPTMVGAGEKFSKCRFSEAWKCYFMTGFCKCSKPSDVQVLRSPQTLQKLLDFDNVVNHFYLNFSNFQKLVVLHPTPPSHYVPGPMPLHQSFRKKIFTSARYVVRCQLFATLVEYLP